MPKFTKWGVAAVCGAMLFSLVPVSDSEGGLFGRRGCGSHGGWRGGWGSHGSYGGWRNNCGSHGGYHNGHGSHGGYVSNGCGSHGGYSRGNSDGGYVEPAPEAPHEAQYRGGYTEERTYTDGVQGRGTEADRQYRGDAARQGQFDQQQRTTGQPQDRTTTPSLNGQDRANQGTQQSAPPPPTDPSQQAPQSTPQPGNAPTDAEPDATNDDANAESDI